MSYSDGATPPVARAYDPAGRLVTMADGTGTSHYYYDALGRLVVAEAGPGGAVGYAYDPAGALTELAYPDGRVVGYSYDPAGRMASLSDGSGRTTSFSYDAGGDLVGEAFPNATTESLSYDPAGAASSIRATGPGGNFMSLLYGRDPRGLLTSEDFTGYRYDSSGRLVSQSPDGTAYGYGTAGDIVSASVPGFALALGYDAAHEMTGVAGSGAATLGYDPEGELTSTSGLLGQAGYSYDQAGRLVGYSGAGHAASYAYGGNGLRSSENADGTTLALTWDQAGPLPTVMAEGPTDLITGPGGLPVEQVAAGGSPYFYATDQLGSTRALTDAAGAVAGSYSYSAYGAFASYSSAVLPVVDYAGGLYDVVSGQYYLGARTYDPGIARFLTVDPLAALTGARYSYAGGSPLNAVDPSGLCAATAQAGGTAAAVVSDPLLAGLRSAAGTGNAVAPAVAAVAFGPGQVLGNQTVLGAAPANTTILASAATPEGDPVASAEGPTSGEPGTLGAEGAGGGLLGENGTQVTSETLTPPNRPYWVDVENPAPGVRAGQLHLQDATGNKYPLQLRYRRV
ncbi:MAG: RHS repeat-associated core domain-containing protein [Acidimicrobiales bacterium]